MSEVAAVVVHYRREAELDRLLDELMTVHGLAPDRIAVVDNGGDATLLEASRARGTRWIALENPGYAAAVNAGVRSLEGADFVLILTHEVRLEPGTIAALAAALDDDPSIGAAGPLLRDDRSGAIWSAGGTTTRIRALPRHLAAGEQSPPRPIPPATWLDGSCIMVRRGEFLDSGALDERFFLYFEDVDLGWRMARQGRGLRVVGDAVAWQAPGGHLDQFYATRNPLWLFRLHRRRTALVLYVAETVGRLLVGGVLKPRGARDRLARRWAGLRAGLSRDYRS